MTDHEKLITNEVKCIDNFVKEIENKDLTLLWYSICSRSFTRLNIPLITTSREIFDELYSNYNMFIYSLKIPMKIKYIEFYEKYFNKTWKLIIDQNNYDIKDYYVENMLERLGHNRWWEEAFQDFSIKEN